MLLFKREILVVDGLLSPLAASETKRAIRSQFNCHGRITSYVKKEFFAVSLIQFIDPPLSIATSLRRRDVYMSKTRGAHRSTHVEQELKREVRKTGKNSISEQPHIYSSSTSV